MTNYRLENLGCGGVLRQILREEISDAEITAIESTIRPFIAIETTHSQDNSPLPWDSHFGGTPYLPVGMDYPQIDDKPAPLLAQFNFAEVPPLDGFPTTGILQFYSVDKPTWEWNHTWFATEARASMSYPELMELAGAKVLFFPDPLLAVADLITDFSFLPPFEHPIVPERLSLRFQIKLAPMDAGGLTTWVEALKTSEFFAENYDYALGELRDRASDNPLLEEALYLLYGDGHRLGGYPAFSQADPRAQLFPLAFGENFPPYKLLFRMVGQPGVELHDAIFYFLIQPSDLQGQNFSNVLFYSDR
ncbi:YwqG family protein [Trichothermofontia sp.]